MARPSRTKTLASLEGKLGTIRQEVQQVLRGLKREIVRREAELAGLKAEYGRGAALLQGQGAGKAAVAAAPVPRRAKRARPIDWKKVWSFLPDRFTLKTLAGHPQAGKRPKSHLYAIVSRWKKEKKLVPDPAGGYRKLSAKSAKPKPRPKPARAPKPVPQPATPTA